MQTGVVCSIRQEFLKRINKNQDKATKPQTVQIVRQGEARLYRFEFNPPYAV
ncbi:transposase [Neisseria gonorrhoeae]|nr:transposase [Neisseria gonorrhoeae]